MLDPCLYNEDPAYLKVITFFCFSLQKTTFLVSAHALNCFWENLLKNLSQKHTSFYSMAVTGVTTVAYEIYFVHLHVCRITFIMNYDGLWVVEWVAVCFIKCINKKNNRISDKNTDKYVWVKYKKSNFLLGSKVHPLKHIFFEKWLYMGVKIV